MKFKNIYYSFWVTHIQNYLQTHNPVNKFWKFNLLLNVSLIFSVDLWTIFIWLKYFRIITFQLPKYTFFPGETLNSAFSYFMVFILPFYILNRILIFRKERYKKLITKYPEMEKKTSLIIAAVFLLAGFFSLLLYSFLIKR
jgi:hypothetical protein